jgi:uncharacterized membrane protein YkgB
MNQLNRFIVYVSRTTPFRSGLDRHLIRAAMVFTFFAFSIQKWSHYTAEMLVPLISHSPVVFWLLPAFGVRGAGYFLGTTETIFGSLIFLGYWWPRLGILGALGSIVTFSGTTTIIPFLPDGWAHEAGGFPIMTLPLPVEGCSVPGRFVLSAQAGSDACGVGDTRSCLMGSSYRVPHMGHPRRRRGGLAGSADQACRQRCLGSRPSAADRRQQPRRCRRSTHRPTQVTRLTHQPPRAKSFEANVDHQAGRHPCHQVGTLNASSDQGGKRLVRLVPPSKSQALRPLVA